MPTTLKLYWKQELANWCPGIPVRLFDAKNQREKVMRKLKKKGGILICSYGMMCTSRLYITRLRYDILVMDEGHKAKNVDTELRKNAV